MKKVLIALGILLLSSCNVSANNSADNWIQVDYKRIQVDNSFIYSFKYNNHDCLLSVGGSGTNTIWCDK